MFLPGGKYIYSHNKFPIRKTNAKLAPIEHPPLMEEAPAPGVIFNDKKVKKAPLLDILKNSDQKGATHFNVYYKNARVLKKKLHLKKIEQSQSFLAKNNSLPDIKQNPVTASPKHHRLEDRGSVEFVSRVDLSSPMASQHYLNPSEKVLKVLLNRDDQSNTATEFTPNALMIDGKAENLHDSPRKPGTHNNENEQKPLNLLETNNGPKQEGAKTEVSKDTDKSMMKPTLSTHYAIKSPRSNRLTQDSDGTPKFNLSKNNILIKSMNFWNYKPDYVRDQDAKMNFQNKLYIRKVDSTLYQ